jgi:uncharacterized membrane protein
LEISGLKSAREQLRNAGVVLYSVAVIATIIPGLERVSSAFVIPYYAFVPGYFVALLLNEKGTLLERLFYSVAWSIAIFASLSSFTALTGYQAPTLSILIPLLTLLLLSYDHYRRQ